LFQNVSKEWEHLAQYYTQDALSKYAKGSEDRIRTLFAQIQPRKVPISSLMNNMSEKTYLVSSPDGWVRVKDCIEKQKSEIYDVEFLSGKRIRASYDHLFQKPDQSWHPAYSLSPGDTIISENDSYEDTITGITQLPELDTLVYDLSVNHPNHRYYTDGICSHNSGKSLVMMNIALNWLEQGLSGVYITLELSEELTSLRTDAMLTNTSTKGIRRDLDTTELKVKMAGKKYGQYRVKNLPAQSTVNDIRSYIKEVQIQTGIKIDFVMVDYLDLVMPSTVKVNPSDAFTKDKYVSEELRNLAKEFNILMITASQLNRGAVGEIEFDHADIGGGISKIQSADYVFGIFTSRSMRERGKYQLQCMKARSSTGVGMKIDLDYDVETMRISDTSEDEEDKQQQSASDIMNKIRNTSNIGTDPLTPNDSPKITADVQSSKLKNMLNNLKTNNS